MDGTLLQEILKFLNDKQLDGDMLCIGCRHTYGGDYPDCRWVELTEKIKAAITEQVGSSKEETMKQILFLLIGWIHEITTIILFSQGVGISADEKKALAERTHQLTATIEEERAKLKN